MNVQAIPPVSGADKPFFSVLVPTTRGHLLTHSLATLLAQDFPSCEIIVSHNAHGDAPPLSNLPTDPRIKHVRTTEKLSVDRSWEFALSHARGEWVLLVGDDDGLLPGAMSLLHQTIEANPAADIFLWKWASFTYADWRDSAAAALAQLPPFTDQAYRIDTTDYLKQLIQFRQENWACTKIMLPSIMRGAYRMSVVDRIRHDTGGLFKLVTPDYAAATAMLAYASSMVFIDKPLCIMGSTPDSLGAAGTGNMEHKNEAYRLIGDPEFGFAKVKDKITNRACIYETLMRIRETLPETLGKLTPDWISFLHWHKVGLDQASVGGQDMAEAQDNFAAVFSTLSTEQKAAWEQRVAEFDQASQDRKSRKANTLAGRVVISLRARLVRLLLRLFPVGGSLMLKITQSQGLSIPIAVLGLTNVNDYAIFCGNLFNGRLYLATYRAKDINDYTIFDEKQ